MLPAVAAADSAKVQKKSTAFLYIAKQNHTLCTLYINRRVHCVFYSIQVRILIPNKNSNFVDYFIKFDNIFFIKIFAVLSGFVCASDRRL